MANGGRMTWLEIGVVIARVTIVVAAALGGLWFGGW